MSDIHKYIKQFAPEGATHITLHEGSTRPGGTIDFQVRWFKQVDGKWRHYTTDSDNEYPGWGFVDMSFFHPEKVIKSLIEL